MTAPATATCAATLLVPNRTSAKLNVIVEPWADEYWLEPGEYLRIDVLAPSTPILEIEHTDVNVIVAVMDPAGATFAAVVERVSLPTATARR